MLKEIGSEFWNDGPTCRDKIYLLSGRTALEYILRDIMKHHNVKAVLLPSYCCHTMIEPFFRHGISVRFYNVYFDEMDGLSVEVPQAQENEIFYYMTYFGFHQLMETGMNKINKDFMVVIEDRTHSWLSGRSGFYADYSYVSYRKWTGFDAIALANKETGSFSDFPEAINTKYSNLRKRASSMKRTFMDSGKGEKQEYLDLFEKAEELLETDYVGYKPSADTMAAFLQLDTTYIAGKRQQNARILIDGLRDIPEIELMFRTVQDDEVPLFVPVLLRENREKLRKYLIDNDIYCPIHWPKSEFHKEISQRAEMLYIQELSLVCDQRYGPDDMNRIVECIRKYYKR